VSVFGFADARSERSTSSNHSCEFGLSAPPEQWGVHPIGEDLLSTETEADEEMEAAEVLPSMRVLDKIMDYETKLERQMYRAMAQLERLQRMRRGEAVPAPLAVEVSEGA
jgi:hypothetical protein